MIRYKCPVCGAKKESPSELGGTVETCPVCGRKIRIPDPSKLRPKITQRREQFASSSNSHQGKKQCPYCKEWIHKDATICPHCRKDPSILGAISSISSSIFWFSFVILAIMFLFGVFGFCV